MSNLDSDSSSESFSDIVLPSIAIPTSTGSFLNDAFKGSSEFNSISCFTQINDKIAQVYADSTNNLSVRTSGINETFTSLPNKGDLPSVREGFCCFEIYNLKTENSSSRSDTKPPSSSSSKRSARMSFSKAKIYSPSIGIFGGKSDSNSSNSELYTYSIETNTWKKITLISAQIGSRYGHRAVSINKGETTFIYVFGGTNGFYLEDNLLLICLSGDFASCSVIECEGTDKPCGRCDHSMTLVTDLYSKSELNVNNPTSAQPPSSQPSQVVSAFSSMASDGQNIQSKDSFDYANNLNNKEISGPAFALIFGGRVSNEKDSIYLNRKFDSNKDKTVLGDLWKLEIRSQFDVPKWTLISREGPQARYSHASFCKNGQFFIAGGYGEKDKPLKDVWRYTFGFGWEEIAVFNNHSIINIFGTPEYGFLQLDDKVSQEIDEERKEDELNVCFDINLHVSPLKMDPALVLLSEEFDKLRKNQRTMWNSISVKMEEIDHLETELKNGRQFIQYNKLSSVRSDKSTEEDDDNLLDCSFGNNMKKVQRLEKQVGDLRLKLLDQSKSNVSSKRSKIEHPKPLCPKLSAYNQDLLKKISAKTEKFQQRKRELEDEIQLYNEQKKQLEKISPKTPEASKTILDATEYIDKLRELETYKEKTKNAEKKLDKMRRKQVLEDQYIMDLVDEVSRCQNKSSKIDKEISKWEGNVERSRIELKMVESISELWGATPKSPHKKSKSKSKGKTSKESSSSSTDFDGEKEIQKILKKNNALRAEIKEELKSFVDTKLTSFQVLVENASLILSNINQEGKQLSECKSVVMEKRNELSQAMKTLEAPFKA